MIRRWLFLEKLFEVNNTIIIKFLVGELNGYFVRINRDNYSAWGFVKVFCQRFDINLTRNHLLLEVFEYNINLSGPAILLKRMASRV